MKRTISIMMMLGLIFSLYGGINSPSVQAKKPVPQIGDIETLGKAMFFDTSLSVNGSQSCASCHDSAVGLTGPNSVINALGAVEPGAVPERFGNRKPPTAAYAGDSPVLYYDPEYNNGSNNIPGSWIGGMFWDGRATGWTLGDPLAEQAMGPFLNPLEMNMPDARQVCIRAAHSDYASLYEYVWEAPIDFAKDSDVAKAYEQIARSIAAYERSAEVNPFTSKFDQFWNNANASGKDITKITAAGIPGGMGGGMGGGGMGGGGMGGGGMGGNPQNNPARWEYYKGLGLTDDELKGLAIFNDAGRGNCASCHSLKTNTGNNPPLFTDFSYHNLGIPKNPDNPFYAMPANWNPDGTDWVDNGLGGFLMSAGYPQEVYAPEMGKFKTPTLRNIDLRPYPEFVKAFGHNGFFKSLDAMDGIIHFYAWRAMMDAGGMGGGAGMTPNPNMFPPPELDANRIKMQPFNFMMDGGYLTAFMKTLSDGYF